MFDDAMLGKVLESEKLLYLANIHKSIFMCQLFLLNSVLATKTN